jgi:hypothetical protein
MTLVQVLAKLLELPESVITIRLHRPLSQMKAAYMSLSIGRSPKACGMTFVRWRSSA